MKQTKKNILTLGSRSPGGAVPTKKLGRMKRMSVNVLKWNK